MVLGFRTRRPQVRTLPGALKLSRRDRGLRGRAFSRRDDFLQTVSNLRRLAPLRGFFQPTRAIAVDVGDREARRHGGAHHRFIVKKEEVAQAVAACKLDPATVREGKEGLFEERLYERIFPTSDPLYYLTRYWLTREVSYCARGYPERGYAKWLVLNFVWAQIASTLRSCSAAE